MVELPEVNDQTLMAIDMAMEKNQWVSSGNVGIPLGNLGHECDRTLWYDFRWTIKKTFDAASLKRFEDGYAVEDLMAKRLRMVDGITLITQDPETGRQVKVTPLNGHAVGTSLTVKFWDSCRLQNHGMSGNVRRLTKPRSTGSKS